jgi:hypothetical protein
MELEEPLGDLWADRVTLVLEHAREPQRFARPLRLVDIDLAPARVHDHDPDEPGADDKPDDEQPPVELGVHRREV